LVDNHPHRFLIVCHRVDHSYTFHTPVNTRVRSNLLHNLFKIHNSFMCTQIMEVTFWFINNSQWHWKLPNQCTSSLLHINMNGVNYSSQVDSFIL
jgi:hypothetical protein